LGKIADGIDFLGIIFILLKSTLLQVTEDFILE